MYETKLEFVATREKHNKEADTSFHHQMDKGKED
jgi:hypothetical protein